MLKLWLSQEAAEVDIHGITPVQAAVRVVK
jgi:hypothetical protein